MSCAGCKCNFCARNCELYVEYVTIGEVSECCFTCDECRNFDGDFNKRNMHRSDCLNYIEPQKYAEAKARREEMKAKAARSKLRLIN